MTAIEIKNEADKIIDYFRQCLYVPQERECISCAIAHVKGIIEAFGKPFANEAGYMIAKRKIYILILQELELRK